MADVHSQPCRGRRCSWFSHCDECDVKGSSRRMPLTHLNSVLCLDQSRDECTHILPLSHQRGGTHTREGGEETLWDVAGGLLVLWTRSPWCQPSDDSHVDEVNFLLAKWERIMVFLGCVCLFSHSFQFTPKVESISTPVLQKSPVFAPVYLL